MVRVSQQYGQFVSREFGEGGDDTRRRRGVAPFAVGDLTPLSSVIPALSRDPAAVRPHGERTRRKAEESSARKDLRALDADSRLA